MFFGKIILKICILNGKFQVHIFRKSKQFHDEVFPDMVALNFHMEAFPIVALLFRYFVCFDMQLHVTNKISEQKRHNRECFHMKIQCYHISLALAFSRYRFGFGLEIF